jgi:hypothetical protein
MAAYNNEWLADQEKFIQEVNVDEETRKAMWDAVLDSMGVQTLAEHYRKIGCPLCGDKDVDTVGLTLVCNACERRVA